MPPDPIPHMTPDQFRRRAHEMVELVARYWESLESLPVNPASTGEFKPGDLLRALPSRPPEGAAADGAWDGILADVSDTILPACTHWQSPHFYGYFPCNASFPAVLGELLSAGLGQQGMLWSTSPACTELEIGVLDWMADLLDLPPSMRSTGSGGGVIHGTASEATLTALVAARDRARRALRAASDPRAASPHFTLYTSTQAHSSVIKGAMIAGLADSPEDRTHLRLVPVDRQQRLEVAELVRLIDQDRRAGRVPFFVSATMGTTGTTAMDPLDKFAGALVGDWIPRPWLHCDAAHAGSCLICPEHRWMSRGLEHFDSFCFNPHKWLLTNFDCDCFYVADRRALVDALSITPEYLRNAASDAGAVTDFRDWQVPLGRRFRALKLWFVLRHYGADGLRAHVREHIRLAALFESWLAADDRFEIMAQRTSNIVCFRLRAGDDPTRRLMETLNRSGRMFLSHAALETPDGRRFIIRFSIGATTTQERHVRQAWEWIREAVENH